MKNYAFSIFAILLFSFAAFGQDIEATTKDGKKVILKPDKTWEFVNDDTAGSGDASEIRTIKGGIVNGKALRLPVPKYPKAARKSRAEGAVNVQVLINEKGQVVSATAISGNELLRAAAEDAARESKFSPTTLEGKPVQVTGIIVYNFVP